MLDDVVCSKDLRRFCVSISILLSSLFSTHAMAGLIISNVGYTSNSISFTIDGDMTGYDIPPAFSVDQFNIQYIGDVWSGATALTANSWSTSLFDNRSLDNGGYTAPFSAVPYTWSRYDASLLGAVSTNRSVVLTLGDNYLDTSATSGALHFVWGNGNPNSTPTLIHIESIGQASVPEPGMLVMLILGLGGFSAIRVSQKRT